MVKLIEDVSTLSGVSEVTLKKLLKASTYSIGHALHESLRQKEEFLTIDIGIGQLQVKAKDDVLRYKFIPSDDLDELLATTVVGGKSPLATKIEDNLQEKIDKAYKELL